MRLKRIGAIVCALTIIFSLIPQSYSVVSAAFEMPETDSSNLSFFEDFESGSGNWTIGSSTDADEAMSREVVNGKAVLASNFYTDAETGRYNAENAFSLKTTTDRPFRHAVIDLKIKVNNQYNGTGAIAPRVSLKDSQGEVFYFGVVSSANQSTAYISAKGSRVCYIDPKKEFDVRIIATSDKFYICAKQGTAAYGTPKEYTRNRDTDFSISVTGPNGSYYFDDISVYDLDYKDATTLSILESPIVVFTGATVTPTVKNAAANATYSIGNTSLATVSGGVITGVAPGVTTLTVTSGGQTDTVPVIVRKASSYVRLAKGTGSTSSSYTTWQTIKINKGEVLDLKAMLESGTTEPDVIWSSTNEEVASLYGLSKLGRTLIANEEGTALVKAVSPHNNKKFSLFVVVEEVEDTATKKVVHKISDTAAHNLKKMLFGFSGFSSYSADANNYFADFGITNIRYSYTGDNFAGLESYYNSMGSNNISNFVILLGDFNNSSLRNAAGFIDTQVAKVDKVVELMGSTAQGADNSHIRIEIGNEMYSISGFQDEYISLANEFATKVKAKYPTVKLGVMVSGNLPDWDSAILAEYNGNPLIDAYIPHFYSTVRFYTGQTADIMMKSVFLRNEYHRQTLINLKNKDLTKELWSTEYGHLQSALHTESNRLERSRTQHSKSIGIALANSEKLLNLLEDNVVDFAHYYAPFDTSGFGLINGSTASSIKLPGYYSMKEMGRLINNYDKFYKIDKVLGDLADGAYFIHTNATSAAGNQYFNYVFDEVDAWGFGNSSGIKEIVVSNRTSTPKKYSLEGKTLTKTWEYSDPNIITDYLTNKGESLGARPCATPVTTGFGAASDEIVLAPNSLTVCRVADGTSKAHLVASIAPNQSNVDLKDGIDLRFSKSVTNVSASLINGDKETSLSVSGSGTKYIASHGSTLIPETDYILSVTAGGVNYEIPFKTRASRAHDDFVYDSSKVFSTTGQLYPTQAVLEFTLTKSSSGGTFAFSKSSTRYYIRDEVISGDDPRLSYLIGHDHFPAGTTRNYRFIFSAALTEIYSKSSDEATYRKVGEIMPYSSDYNYVKYESSYTSGVSLSDVKVYVNKSNVSDIIYTQIPDGDTVINLWRVFKGETNVKFTVNGTEPFNIFLVEYAGEDEKELKSMYVKTEADGNTFDYILDKSDVTRQKIMIFDADFKSMLLNSITNRQ